MSYSSEVLADSPLGYWRCDDALTLYAATASSSYNASTNPPWGAFADDGSGAWLANGTGSGWLQAQLTSALAITQYAFVREDYNGGQRCAKDWTFQGSNDGSTWTTLDTRTGIVWTTAGETKTFTFTNSTAYRYYRINVTATNGDPYLTIKGMTLGTSSVLLRNAAGTGRGAVPTRVTLGASSASALGTAVSFDGSTSHADIPYASWQDTPSAVTVEAWVKHSGTGYREIITKDNSGGGAAGSQWRIRVNPSNQIEFLVWHSGLTVVGSSTVLTAGTWYHVVGTYSAATGVQAVYINGALDASTSGLSGNVTTGSQPITIGQLGNGTELYSGTLDEIAVYSTALSASRILAHYTAGTATATPTSGSASLSLTASGGAGATSGGSASLSLSASGGTSAVAGGSASLSLSASGALTPPVPASGSASLSLSASGGASGSPGGTASLNLIATGTAIAVLAASGSATLTLTASGSAVMSAGGTATLTLTAGGVALALYETDTSNALDGLDLLLTATVIFPVPIAAAPAGLAERHDVAVPYPVPVMVDGRPT